MSANLRFPDDFVAVSSDPRVSAASDVLVGGQGLPSDPAKGIGMLLEAMGQGSGAAAERLAVLAALGVARPSDWIEAINLLVRAPSLGVGLLRAS